MRRVIGIDIHRTFGEVVIWEEGIVRHFGRVDMTRTALEGFGKSLRFGRSSSATLRHCVVLRKGGGDEGGDHAPPALACMGERIA